uniref:Si:dkey-10o6.2 n=1 Tax=Myripristis murdjan TaxID=586833 RepID=A0A667XQ35_9TELE
MNLPVVDFSAFNLNENDVVDDQLHVLSKELKTAFTEIGFVYLKNTGITQEEVDHVMAISKNFFLQPEELKRPFSRKTYAHNPFDGWVSSEAEWLNPRRPGDLKEAFNISSLRSDINWPSSGAAAGFKDAHISFFLRCKELSLRILRVMAHSLDLDPEVFLSTHRLMGSDESLTTLRTLYYPPVNSEKVKEGQVRCGEHSDYGSITLVFQGQEGLQVLNRSGEYISVPVIPGAVLVNIADLMQRWTGDLFISAVHRVLLPPAGDCSARQSLAFFLHPDDEAMITCIDGSNKYPPIKSHDYSIAQGNKIY